MFRAEIATTKTIDHTGQGPSSETAPLMNMNMMNGLNTAVGGHGYVNNKTHGTCSPNFMHSCTQDHTL